jgi:hypothetical protein
MRGGKNLRVSSRGSKWCGGDGGDGGDGGREKTTAIQERERERERRYFERLFDVGKDARPNLHGEGEEKYHLVGFGMHANLCSLMTTIIAGFTVCEDERCRDPPREFGCTGDSQSS